METDEDDHVAEGDALLTGVACYLEKMRPDAAPYLTVATGVSLFLCVIPGLPDVQVGDRVEDRNAVKYIVKDLQTFDNSDVPNHTELTLTVGWTRSQ